MITEITARSILRKYKKIDSWFVTRFGINLYRGCAHDCSYCDGRAEQYRVEGDYARDIQVKTNAVELLHRELDPSRRRKPLPRSFMVLGGGVCDAYQPVEERYRLARGALQCIHSFGYPVHVLTKSCLVERDLDILRAINDRSRAIVSFSFSTVDDEVGRIVEPGVPAPSRRLATIRKCKEAGLSCGMFLLPVIPFVTDGPAMIRESLEKGRDAGIDFVIFGAMTLKEGRQREHFMRMLQRRFPDALVHYDIVYQGGSRWGEPASDYSASLNELAGRTASALTLPTRIPPSLFADILSVNDRVVVILEQLDYLLRMRNRTSPYGYAAWSLSKVTEPIATLPRHDLRRIKGVGPVTARTVREIVDTGTCRLYERLL